MNDILSLCLLTFVASGIGTATGFGTSTVMIPVMVLFTPMPVALLFVGIIHLCGDIWKLILFRSGLQWALVLGFGLAGIAAAFLGASLSVESAQWPLKRILGAFLLGYVAYLFLKRDWAMPQTHRTAVTGGLLSGFCAGFFGVGGAVRGAFLMAFNLPKAVYICTSGTIALLIDVTRVSRYLAGGTRLDSDLTLALAFCVPISLLSAWTVKKFLDRIPQKSFRLFVGVFLALVGARLLIWN